MVHPLLCNILKDSQLNYRTKLRQLGDQICANSVIKFAPTR